MLEFSNRDRTLQSPEPRLDDEDDIAASRVGAVSIKRMTQRRFDRSDNPLRHEIDGTAATTALFQDDRLARPARAHGEPMPGKGQSNARRNGVSRVEIQEVETEAFLRSPFDDHTRGPH